MKYEVYFHLYLKYMFQCPHYAVKYVQYKHKLGITKFVSKQPACLGSWLQGDWVIPEKNHLIDKTYQDASYIMYIFWF